MNAPIIRMVYKSKFNALLGCSLFLPMMHHFLRSMTYLVQQVYDQIRCTIHHRTVQFYFHKHMMHGWDLKFTLSSAAFVLANHSSENIFISVLKKKKRRRSRKNLKKREEKRKLQAIPNIAYRCLKRELITAFTNDLEVLKEFTVRGILLKIVYSFCVG